jgi:hypothetical protein
MAEVFLHHRQRDSRQNHSSKRTRAEIVDACTQDEFALVDSVACSIQPKATSVLNHNLPPDHGTPCLSDGSARAIHEQLAT